MKNMKLRYIGEDEYDRWDKFVDSSPQGNIFNKSFFIKAVSDALRILVCEENGRIIGGIALPHTYGRFYRNPKLTPQLGILLPPLNPEEKHSKRLSREIDIIKAIIHSLPDFLQLDYSFSYNFSNLLPFIWEGYNLNVYYTYVLENIKDLDIVYKNFDYDIKYEIKRAMKNGLIVKSDPDIKRFYEINKKSYARQDMEMPYTLDLLVNLDEAMQESNSRKMLFAVNKDGRAIAAVYLIYDARCTYYLMGGADPEYRNTGAQSLLLWEGIKFASNVSAMFDFEGSVKESIESYFRKFGGNQKIIYNIYKSSPLIKMIYNIARKNKNIVRKIIKV
ncbi:MAG: GNAT family N-acetyltransferase [Clostridiales bacterium]|nr:GNAT family N-acetyltransferase [Clostridiales bacterium]